MTSKEKKEYINQYRKASNEFPARLRSLREKEKKSRVILSQLCGLPDSAIRRYECGEIKPNVDSLIAIADYFHVSVDYLIGRTNY